MKKTIFTLGIILAIGLFYIWKQSRKSKLPEKSAPPVEKTPEFKITIVYDNNSFDERLKTDWGFSCLIEGPEETTLFDTGADANVLLANMEKLGVDPEIIDKVAISHIHSDHLGGLTGFLDKNSNPTVYLPSSFPQAIKNDVKNHGAELVEIDNPIKIGEGLYSTGELYGPPKEQSLIARTKKGLIVITGCAHPGVVNIIKKAKGVFPGENVHLVLGGFHLGGTSTSQLKEIIKDFRNLGVKKAAPCHCSGDRCRELFKKEYGNDYIEVGVGKVIDI